jgi:hypothetical protein
VSTIGIILSGKYSDLKITKQYGLVPPSFLPVSGKRLFVPQIDYLKRYCEKVILTIPIDYEVPKQDMATLDALNVATFRTSLGLSINEALLEVLATVQTSDCGLCVLYGDTLIDDDLSTNSVAIYEMPNVNSWGRNQGIIDYENSQHHQKEMMMAGLFLLSDTNLFLHSMAISNGDILNALDCYSDICPLTYQVVDSWMDFGHLETLQQSKLSLPETRYFNSIQISEGAVRKVSTNVEKLKAEVAWYKGVPKSFRKYVPALLGSTSNSYTLEYIACPTVHELLTLGNLSFWQWEELFQKLGNFFHEAKKSFEPNHQVKFSNLMIDKTRERCQSFLSSKPALLDFSQQQLAEILSNENIELLLSKIDFSNSKNLGIFHGDMCATNIFWDGSSKALKVIDPRGSIGFQSNGLYGDIRYDVAKLYQSFILGYDFILAGISSSSHSTELFLEKTELSNSIDFHSLFQKELLLPLDIEQTEIAAISTLLMFGLLPLHNDRADRQNAFLHIIVKMLDKIST